MLLDDTFISHSPGPFVLLLLSSSLLYFLLLSLSIFQLRSYWITPVPKVLICLFHREFCGPSDLSSPPVLGLAFIFFFTNFHKLEQVPQIISSATTPLNQYLRVFYLLEWNVYEIITGFACPPFPVKPPFFSFRELPLPYHILKGLSTMVPRLAIRGGHMDQMWTYHLPAVVDDSGTVKWAKLGESESPLWLFYLNLWVVSALWCGMYQTRRMWVHWLFSLPVRENIHAWRSQAGQAKLTKRQSPTSSGITSWPRSQHYNITSQEILCWLNLVKGNFVLLTIKVLKTISNSY